MTATEPAAPAGPTGPVCIAGPDAYEWPAGRRAAAVLSVDFDGPSPYLWAIRQGSPELLGELEQRRFGPRQGVWRVLAMLKRLRLRASFFVPGAVAEAHPGALEAILTAGHEVGLHGYLHERVDQLSPDENRQVLDRSRQALAAAGVIGPLGYRSPSWEMTPVAWQALREVGVDYDSSLMGYDHPYWLEGLVEVPVQWSLDDAIFYRYVAGTAHVPVPPSVVIDDWSRELRAAGDHHALAVITIHPWLSGRAGRLDTLEAMLEEAMLDSGVWWATAAEVAAHHRSSFAADDGDALRPGQL